MNWFKKVVKIKRTAVSLNNRGLPIVNPHIRKQNRQKCVILKCHFANCKFTTDEERPLNDHIKSKIVTFISRICLICFLRMSLTEPADTVQIF